MRENRSSGSVEGVMGNHGSYSDSISVYTQISGKEMESGRMSLRGGERRRIVPDEHRQPAAGADLRESFVGGRHRGEAWLNWT